MNAAPEKENINYLSLLLIIFINGLFCYKYSLRLTSFALSITIIYSLVTFALPFIARLLPDRFGGPVMLYALVAVYVIADIIYLTEKDPYSLNVDRWSVITSFWDALLRGSFPYLAKSHMGNYPGPYPFYFVIALPFYLAGEIGYLSLAGLLLLLWFVRFHFAGRRVRWILTVCMLSSTAILWEVSVRSAILINGSLILFYIAWLNRGFDSMKGLIISGIIGGLLLSTRSIVIIPLLMCWSFYLLKGARWRAYAVVAGSSAAGFALTLLPFLVWDYRTFIQYNPVTIQSSFLPLPFAALFIIASFFAGFFVRTLRGLFFHSGLFIFGVVMSYLLYEVHALGYTPAYIESQADISYLILALPFLFASLYEGRDGPGRVCSVRFQQELDQRRKIYPMSL